MHALLQNNGCMWCSPLLKDCTSKAYTLCFVNKDYVPNLIVPPNDWKKINANFIMMIHRVCCHATMWSAEAHREPLSAHLTVCSCCASVCVYVHVWEVKVPWVTVLPHTHAFTRLWQTHINTQGKYLFLYIQADADFFAYKLWSWNNHTIMEQWYNTILYYMHQTAVPVYWSLHILYNNTLPSLRGNACCTSDTISKG